MDLWKPLNILSYGAGMPSTSLVGMACENARRGYPVISTETSSPVLERTGLPASRSGRWERTEKRENAAPVYL